MILVFYRKLFEPYINDGDVMVVDKSKTEAFGGRFYLVNINNETFVRRIYRTINGYLTLAAVDPILSKELYPYEKVEIIGQIIYRQGFI